MSGKEQYYPEFIKPPEKYEAKLVYKYFQSIADHLLLGGKKMPGIAEYLKMTDTDADLGLSNAVLIATAIDDLKGPANEGKFF